MEVLPDGPLEIACIQRANQGFLDALCIQEEECPICIQKLHDELTSFANVCAVAGCPLDRKSCRKGCSSAREAAELQQSPYANQLRMIAE